MAIVSKAVQNKASALDELNQLALAGKAQEDVAREEVGGQNSFIKLIGDPQAKELKKDKPEYIKGAEYGSFIIGNKKLHLGKEFNCTIVGMFKLYEETEAKKESVKGQPDALPKVLGYWMPEDAENIPVDGMFDRPFVSRSGEDHVLKPVHWLAVRLDDFPELTDVIISFRSTGNSVYAKLAKLVKNSSEIAPQLRLKVTSQGIENKTYGKTNLYPDFTVIGKNFEFTDGAVALIPEAKGGMSLADVKDTLALYASLNTEYSANRMVSKKTNIAALIGTSAPATALTATAGKKGKYVTAEDDETPTKF